MDSKKWQYSHTLTTIGLVITIAVFIIDGVSTQRINVVRQQIIDHRIERLEAELNSARAIMRGQDEKITDELKKTYFRLIDEINKLKDAIKH